MSAFDPAVMRDTAVLILAIAALVRAIWPHGIF
jgi:hypothetical protein